MFSTLSAGDSPLLLGEKWCQSETCLAVSLPARIRPWGRRVGPPPRQAGGACPAPAPRPPPRSGTSSPPSPRAQCLRLLTLLPTIPRTWSGPSAYSSLSNLPSLNAEGERFTA